MTGHPTDDLLMAYAAGALSSGAGLVVAVHLTHCPGCRRAVAAMDAVGGALLGALPPAAVSAGARERTMARLDSPAANDPAADEPDAAPPPAGRVLLPAAIRRCFGTDVDAMAWTRVLRGVDQVMVDLGDGTRTRLMRIRAGTAVPAHTHRGQELVCVLAGSFSDSTGRYGPGDVAIADESVDHRPTADPDGDCICLAVTEAPVVLTGRFWRLLNGFVRF
ncbi:MAG: ChrR family anti-sigma-E factor [Alphaproteobacteria bacterium]